MPLAIDPPLPPLIPRRQLCAFSRVRVTGGAAVELSLPVTSEEFVLTDAAGERAPAPGTYTLVICRGPPGMSTDDLSVNVTIVR